MFVGVVPSSRRHSHQRSTTEQCNGSVTGGGGGGCFLMNRCLVHLTVNTQQDSYSLNNRRTQQPMPCVYFAANQLNELQRSARVLMQQLQCNMKPNAEDCIVLRVSRLHSSDVQNVCSSDDIINASSTLSASQLVHFAETGDL